LAAFGVLVAVVAGELAVVGVPEAVGWVDLEHPTRLTEAASNPISNVFFISDPSVGDLPWWSIF